MAVSTTRLWLPHFCRLPELFSLMVVAELVVVLLALAPPYAHSGLRELGLASVFVQWLALLNAVVLCSLSEVLQRRSLRGGFVIAWLLSISTTALGSAVVYSMDHALGLGLTPAAGQGVRFVLGNALICALLAAALLRYLQIRELWQERVRAAAKAQVDALQARIRPHFLFNSMNTIASLIRTRPAQAEQAVEDLSDLFRAALGATDAVGTLGEELDLIGHYLRIECLRLGDRLTLDVDVTALPRSAPMPQLLLQPLVENAICHGIQRLPAGGTLQVRGERGDGWLRIEVRNPCPPDAAIPRNAHALANVRARIGYHFGARGELLVKPGAGEFVVSVRWPDEDAS